MTTATIEKTHAAALLLAALDGDKAAIANLRQLDYSMGAANINHARDVLNNQLPRAKALKANEKAKTEATDKLHAAADAVNKAQDAHAAAKQAHEEAVNQAHYSRTAHEAIEAGIVARWRPYVVEALADELKAAGYTIPPQRIGR